MFNFFKRLSPNDPSSTYKMAGLFAKIGVVGYVLAVLIQIIVNGYIYSGSMKDCDFTKISNFNETCISLLMENRYRTIGWHSFSHLITLFFHMLTCVPFFIMEDLYADHEGAPFMRDCLILGVVLECMRSAFRSGLGGAAGRVGHFFQPNKDLGINVHFVLEMGYTILRQCFTWVTFLRDGILALGMYMTAHYDSTNEVIGGTWRIFGYCGAIVGLVTVILEFLKVIQYNTFNNLSDFTYGVFLVAYLVWLYMFGSHCSKLSSPEEDGMLNGADTSGSDVSDEDAAPAAPVVAAAASEEEAPEEAPKKKRKHRSKRMESSDDDV